MTRKTFTVADHLLGKNEAIVALYEQFVQLVEVCGPFEYVVGKDAIAFKGKRRNFAVAKPKARWLDGVLVLPRILQDPKIRAALPYTKRLFGNQFRVTELAQLDRTFADWIQEAYQVGQGSHLRDELRPNTAPLRTSLSRQSATYTQSLCEHWDLDGGSHRVKKG